MKIFPIGFRSTADKESSAVSEEKAENMLLPKKSVVRVYFPSRGITLSYYNDRFNLQKGDMVYVDGKLEGEKGIVTDVVFSFKIKLSEYKRIIAAVHNKISGNLYLSETHVLSFNRSVLSFEQVRPWFLAPVDEEDEEEYAVGDDTCESFPLDDLSQMKISDTVAERGRGYYAENRVCFLSLDGENGKAVVSGTRPYIVDFTLRGGIVTDINCSCFCAYTCKHDLAVLLQLKECLETVNREYKTEYSDYFSAVTKDVFAENVLMRAPVGKMNICI